MARYDVPMFMDIVWFQADGTDSRRRQGWFKHIGNGSNIRSADVPVRLSKKMAHHFLSAPDDCTVEEALRWGQILGQNGSSTLARAITKTRLGRGFEDEPFWNTVILFLIRHSGIRIAEVGPLVDYLHHRKFAAQENEQPDGSVEQGPPREPNLSMKSRSLRKLRRQVDRYKETWTMEAQAPGIDVGSKKYRPAHFYHEETHEGTGRTLYWSIQGLQTARSLANEGEVMNHCVGAYGKKLGGTSIWSVQVRDGEVTHRVLTVAIDITRRVVTEARGRFNADPGKEFDAQEALEENGRGRGRLKARDRYFLARSYKVLRMWLDREKIAYSKNDME